MVDYFCYFTFVLFWEIIALCCVIASVLFCCYLCFSSSTCFMWNLYHCCSIATLLLVHISKTLSNLLLEITVEKRHCRDWIKLLLDVSHKSWPGKNCFHCTFILRAMDNNQDGSAEAALLSLYSIISATFGCLFVCQVVIILLDFYFAILHSKQFIFWV